MFAGTLRTLPQLARSREYRRSYMRFSRRVKLREALLKYNRAYWLKNPAGFVEYNAAILDFNEPHSTKQSEDLIEWGLTADPVAMADSFAALDFDDTAILREPDEIRCLLLTGPLPGCGHPRRVGRRRAAGMGPRRGEGDRRPLPRGSEDRPSAAGAPAGDRQPRAARVRGVAAMSEQSRARYPDETGFVERDGVRSFYEVYGEGDTTILLLPAWCVVYSRLWKGQIPYFARHHRVVTFDGRGNGRSDRPTDPAAHRDSEIIADAIAVLDATGTERAVVVGVSMGGWWAPLLAGLHPDRVEGAVLICPASILGDPDRGRVAAAGSFDEPSSGSDDWAGKWNRDYWLSDFSGFADFFARKIHTEPHSTKQLEDMTAWIHETSPEVLLATVDAPAGRASRTRARGACPTTRPAEASSSCTTACAAPRSSSTATATR